mmetsp:Transcript_71040/g.197341  ORF Transcript_71040/g.197341 Transcript_71040/m.197341 type:complete len:318 (+) Transcript_71040:743-1696(+)
MAAVAFSACSAFTLSAAAADASLTMAVTQPSAGQSGASRSSAVPAAKGVKAAQKRKDAARRPLGPPPCMMGAAIRGHRSRHSARSVNVRKGGDTGGAASCSGPMPSSAEAMPRAKAPCRTSSTVMSMARAQAANKASTTVGVTLGRSTSKPSSGSGAAEMPLQRSWKSKKDSIVAPANVALRKSSRNVASLRNRACSTPFRFKPLKVSTFLLPSRVSASVAASSAPSSVPLGSSRKRMPPRHTEPTEIRTPWTTITISKHISSNGTVKSSLNATKRGGTTACFESDSEICPSGSSGISLITSFNAAATNWSRRCSCM